MKKWMFVTGVAVVALAAVAAGLGLGTYVAFAQDEPPTSPWPGSDPRGMMGGWWDGQASGPIHEAMIAAMAETLDLTEEQLEARLANGETLAQIAQAQGMSPDEFQVVMTEARQAAVQEAVEQGLLTQKQADWMLQRTQGTFGRGGCSATGGARMMGWRLQ